VIVFLGSEKQREYRNTKTLY